jgi:broad specificity phosphatase PhoE
MARVLLMRHAEAMSSVQGPEEEVLPDDMDGLTVRGQRQAAEMGAWLRTWATKLVLVASPIRRAKETADIIAGITQCSFTTDLSLRERDFNFKANTSVRFAKSLQEQAFEFPSVAIEGSESVIAHRKRVFQWWKSYCPTMMPQFTYVVLSHGGTIEHLLACLLGNDPHCLPNISTKCEPARFHLWSTFQTQSGKTIWCLEGVNLSAGAP